jgi:RNA polymerase sigma factor for flagellar operon FliA
MDPQPSLDHLYQQGRPVVRRVARRMCRRFGGSIEFEELDSLGLQALIKAAKSFDPQRCDFVPYLTQRLKWIMLGAARKRARRRLDATRGAPLGAARSYGSAPLFEQRDDEQVGRICVGGDLSELAIAETPDPEAEAIRREQSRAIHGALDALPRRLRSLVEAHYFGGTQLNQVACDMGVSVGTASRLHDKSIHAIARHLQRVGKLDD